MPKNKQSGKRISFLFFILSSNNFLSKNEILQKLNEEFDLDVSWETVKKDFQEINKDGKIIDYDPKNGYYLSDRGGYLSQFSYTGEQRKALELASGILSELEDISLIKEFDSIIKKILKVDSTKDQFRNYFRSIIQLETVPKSEGKQWINPIFKSIRNSRTISLTYKKFDSPVSKDYHVHPYLLKEYRNRWYLVCRKEGTAHIITFALDRIQQVKENDEPLVWQNFNPEEYYKYSLGITSYETEEILDIKLKVSSSQLQYLKTLPLHHSQQIMEESEEFGIVTLKVLYSYELVKEIMAMNQEIEVLAPISLREEVAGRLKKALKRYE